MTQPLASLVRGLTRPNYNRKKLAVRVGSTLGAKLHREARYVAFKTNAYRYDDASLDGLRSLSSRFRPCCQVLYAVERGDSGASLARWRKCTTHSELHPMPANRRVKPNQVSTHLASSRSICFESLARRSGRARLIGLRSPRGQIIDIASSAVNPSPSVALHSRQ